jgi:hypothetical protein
MKRTKREGQARASLEGFARRARLALDFLAYESRKTMKVQLEEELSRPQA